MAGVSTTSCVHFKGSATLRFVSLTEEQRKLKAKSYLSSPKIKFHSSQNAFIGCYAHLQGSSLTLEDGPISRSETSVIPQMR